MCLYVAMPHRRWLGSLSIVEQYTTIERQSSPLVHLPLQQLGWLARFGPRPRRIGCNGACRRGRIELRQRALAGSSIRQTRERLLAIGRVTGLAMPARLSRLSGSVLV